MGQVQLGDWRFEVDPSEVSWSINVKVTDGAMLGGKVIQVLGTSTSDMTLVGWFGSGGWRLQREFISWVKDTARKQAEVPVAPPLRLTIPQRGWDFKVLLKDLKEPGANRSANLDVANFAPKFRLTLHIVTDNAKLNRVAQDVFLSRLARIEGWHQTPFNGFLTGDEVGAFLKERGAESVGQAIGISFAGQSPVAVGGGES